MAEIVKARMTAEAAGEFCIFLIGARINKPWKVHRWLPVVRAMRAMLKELEGLSDSGFLGVEQWFGNPSIMVQYWRSFEQLEAYATARDLSHLPAWAAFNRDVGSNGDVGIWHETYRVRPGDFECVYNNMPRFGLARAFSAVPATGRRESAPGRMRASGR
ncbi:MAG TPA: DUF4188 domain-containing protein [Myxococcota bacterium]|nr:DUF4188 domain-containing protein [Myxococcota bacterium]